MVSSSHSAASECVPEDKHKSGHKRQLSPPVGQPVTSMSLVRASTQKARLICQRDAHQDAAFTLLSTEIHTQQTLIEEQEGKLKRKDEVIAEKDKILVAQQGQIGLLDMEVVRLKQVEEEQREEADKLRKEVSCDSYCTKSFS